MTSSSRQRRSSRKTNEGVSSTFIPVPLKDATVVIDDEIVDAISTLTGLTQGDVHDKIGIGGFKVLAIQALKKFARNYQLIERKPDTEFVDDNVILNRCLAETEREIKELTSSGSNPKELRELNKDAANLRQRLNITS